MNNIYSKARQKIYEKPMDHLGNVLIDAIDRFEKLIYHPDNYQNVIDTFAWLRKTAVPVGEDYDKRIEIIEKLIHDALSEKLQTQRGLTIALLNKGCTFKRDIVAAQFVGSSTLVYGLYYKANVYDELNNFNRAEVLLGLVHRSLDLLEEFNGYPLDQRQKLMRLLVDIIKDMKFDIMHYKANYWIQAHTAFIMKNLLGFDVRFKYDYNADLTTAVDPEKEMY